MSSETGASVKRLEANASKIGLGQIFYGPSVALNYNDPTVDPRAPDIIVTPNIDPSQLDAVRIEGTGVLPDFDIW
jgi:hypothetical protein